MTKAVQVPVLGEQKQTEILVNLWYVEPGQTVTAGTDLVELVTDKAAFNLPSPDSGRVVKLWAQEGAKVKPGETLLEIETGS